MPRANSAKEDTPSPREYRCLKRAAREEVDNPNYDTEDFRLECTFLLRVMGELGLRAGELVHMREGWVDFDQNEIHIPEKDMCTKGKDNGPCGYCKDRAQKRADASDNMSYEKALRQFWQPKNEAAEREIWFGWNEELIEIIDEFLYKHGQYPRSRSSANRRIDKIASECDMIDKNDIYPHALRGYAAKFHAKKGMRAYQLKEFMGWSDVSAAMDYIQLAANDVKSELKRVHKNPMR